MRENHQQGKLPHQTSRKIVITFRYLYLQPPEEIELKLDHAEINKRKKKSPLLPTKIYLQYVSGQKLDKTKKSESKK